MRIFNKFKGTRGFISLWERVIRFRYMITDDAERRARMLAFWERHGDAATKEAFDVSRPTLFRWQKALMESHGRLEGLNRKSTAPKGRRRRDVPEGVEKYIIRERTEHPRLSKEKLATMMRDDLHLTLSFSRVGRIMADMKKRNALPLYHKPKRSSSSKKKVRRNGFMPAQEGELLEIDTVVTSINGERRYTPTAIDLFGRFAHAHTYKSASSKTATLFLQSLQDIAPFSICRIQTDNGSEFAKHFAAYLEESGIVHFHAYPRCPKMNSHIERFNRTIQEEYMYRHMQTLSVDLELFNEGLAKWMRWCNEKRPHLSLGLLSPLQYSVRQLQEKSHM